MSSAATPDGDAGWAARVGDVQFVSSVLGQASALAGSLAALPGGERPALAAFLAELRAEAGAAGPDDQGRARAAFATEVADALETLGAPLSWGEQAGELLDWIGARLVGVGLDGAPPDFRAEADRAAVALAATLDASDPTARAAAIEPDWSPVGCLAVLAAMPPAPRAAFTAELAEVIGWPTLVGAAIRPPFGRDGGATGQDGAVALLAPDSPAGQVIDLAHSQASVLRYAAEIGQRATASLSDLPALLLAIPVPAALSRLAAALHDALAERFGAVASAEVVRGVLLARVLAPALPPPLAEAVAELLAAEPEGALVAVDAALADYAAEIVGAGRAAERAAGDGEDPDDLAVQRGAALLDADALMATFRDPTPDDKLGTLPAVRVTVLGQAILAARSERPSDDIDWTDVIALQDGDPLAFETLLLAERGAVLDLVRAPSGERIVVA